MKKILIIGPSWIGDMVMAQSLFRLLKSQDGSVTIDVLAPKWSQPILACMPEVRNAVVMPVGHGSLQLMTRYKLAKSLRAEKYDQAIVLANSFKSALIPFWAKIPVRTGWRGEMRYGLINDMRILNKAHYPLMVERYLALGLSKGESFNAQDYWPKLTPDAGAVNNTLEKFALSLPLSASEQNTGLDYNQQKKPLLILCPGAAYGPSKRWPEDYFAQVAEYFINQNWRVGLLGGPAEKSAVDQVNQYLKTPAVDLTASSLSEAVELLSAADAVVSNDSGMMHVACAVDSYTVAIYGSTSPGFTPPLSHNAQALTKLLPCKPCFKRECPLGHLDCLKQITPNEVIALIEKEQES